MMPALTAAQEDAKWRAESDARTLAESLAINQDSARLKRAKTAAKKMAKDETLRTDALRKVAGLSSLLTRGGK